MKSRRRLYSALFIMFLQLFLVTCSDGDIEAPILAEGSLSYATPSWSCRDEIAYVDFGGRLVDSHSTTIIELAGIWVYSIVQDQSRQITHDWANAVSWSPDGLDFVICSNRSLWKYNMVLGEIDTLVCNGAWNNPGDWSSCDSSVVYSSDEGASYSWTLWKVDPATRMRESLLDGAGGVVYPHWVAGCDTIVYGLVKSDYSLDIRWFEQESRHWGLVLNTGVHVEDLNVSPDGRFVSYTEPKADGGLIRIYDRIMSNYVQGPRDYGRYASWSPDSRKIVFVMRARATENGVNSNLAIFSLDDRRTRIIF